MELILAEATQLAELMVEHNGDLIAVSRDVRTEHNAMSLRRAIAADPEVRKEYHRLLTEKLQEAGLHITERILKMVRLQNQCFGSEEVPADPRMAIALSREISTLISEGKNQKVSGKAAVLMTSKEDAKEILLAFLDS